MKNKIIRTFTVTLAAVLCLTAFSTTAFAGGTDPNPEPLPETTEAPQEEEPTTGGMEPKGVPVTPEGNATLVDDFYGDKQLITVTTKAGNYFYILIDRANEDKETAVHFLNQVDDADLQALLEDGKAAPETCTCTTKCAAGAVNTNCPVCKTNMTECTGPEPEPQEPEETEQPQEDEAKGSGMGGLVVFLVVALIGGGSSVFHPESSRVAQLASGGRKGLAQSIFQVGGNFGSSLGPLLAAVIIAPYGKGNVAWFVLAALLAIVVLAQISRWYSAQHRMNKGKPKATIINPLPRNKVVLAVSILLILIFSKYFYMASISSYYTFYLMQKFGLSIQNAQLHLFAFLFAVAAGTVIGGPVGDKIGRKYVIWGSILGVAPFTLILPSASLHWTGVLTVIIGFILASAFSAILVYAQELLPGRIGMVSGLFFGFAFGMGGLGAAVLGLIADHTSIELVYKICAFLPLLGMLTIFLPDNRHKD